MSIIISPNAQDQRLFTAGWAMRPRSVLSSIVRHMTALPQVQTSRRRPQGMLPFYLIESIALCVDVIVIIATSVLTGIAYHLAFLAQVGSVETFLAIGLLTCTIFCAIMAARGAYQPKNLVNFPQQASLTIITWIFVFFLLSAAAFSFKITEIFSRGAILTFFAVGCVALSMWRLVLARGIVHALAEGRFAEQRVLLLAEKRQLTALNVIDELKRCGYLPVRTFEFLRDSVSSKSGSPQLLESIDDIIAVTRQEQIECVFLLISWDDRNAIQQLMEQLRVLSIPVYLLPDSNVAYFLGGRIVNVGTTWTAELKRAPLTPIERACKRLLDLVIASVGLITLAPLMLLVGAAIKIESDGPVFFRQIRNGFNGRPFRMCKFRTMSVLEDGPVIRQVTKDDPRVTPLGRLLRRTNIDELPQLFNVIAGDMSLVGPRPHASAHNSEYERTVANYAYRYHVKPGLTGWAQVNGLRGETKTVDLMEKRIELDLWYINNWSFLLDFKILLRTLSIGLQPSAY